MDEITEETGTLVARVAALDIGKASLTACVRVPHESRAGARRQEVRTYGTTTSALLELRDWLACQGVTLVVTEATSAYWKPPSCLMEDDIECQVASARDARNVPGRPKTFLASRFRRVARRRGKKRALVAVGNSILVIVWHLLSDPAARFTDLGPDWHDRLAPVRRKRQLIADLERLTGKKVTLNDAA